MRRNRVQSAPVLAALGLSLLLGAGCRAVPGEAVGSTREALTTTVTYQEGVLGAVTDTTLSASAMSQSFGGQPVLRVSCKNEALLSFDLSSIPSNAVINSATLTLYLNGGGNEPADACPDGNRGDYPAVPITLYRATAPWSPDTATYAGFGQSFDPTVVGTIVPQSSNVYKSVGITALVQAWVSGQAPNDGVVLRSTDKKHANFVSSEGSKAALRPSLTISYTTPDDHCSPNPCQNGGACTNGASGYTCACAPGYTGGDCQTLIDNCAPSPCQNGGVCTNGVGSYTCACVPGYTGDNCQTLIDDCAPSPCQNGGTCSSGVNSYSCTCAPGYTGQDCQTLIDNCSPDPCQNGGTCTNGVNSYTCACAPGYTGQSCQTLIDNCAGAPCLNGGACTSGIDTYTCACAPGYAGQNCEIDVDECAPSPCQNGGQCVDGVNGYTCTCAPGYTGNNCETLVDNCSPNPCQNGGTCESGVNSYTCTCPAGYTGATCQVAVSTCLPVTLDSGQGSQFLAVDATNVYWSDSGDDTEMSVPKGGGTPVTLASGVGLYGAPNAIAVDASNLYWGTDDGQGAILTAPIGGGAPSYMTFWENTYVEGIAVDSTSVYWVTAGVPSGATGPGSGAVMSVPITYRCASYGCNATEAPAVLATGANNGIALDAANVYFTGSGTVMSVPKGGGAAVTLASGQNNPAKVAVDAANVYWTNAGDGTVMSVPKGGGTPTVLASGQGSPWGIAVDAAGVYWTAQSGAGGALMSVPIGGGAPTVLASVSYTPWSVVVDAASVYWVGGGNVTKVAKSCGAPASCAAILAANPGAGDGVYSIQPPGQPSAFQAYCDMTTDGGGWTLMATLTTTNVLVANSDAAAVWGAWSDDWWALDHGAPTDPTAAFSNLDSRRFAGLVGPGAVLRAESPATSVRRYHFGFAATDWALWNASRYVGGVNVVGPFDLPNVLVSLSPDLSSPVEAQLNGHWYNGAFYLGTAPNAADGDSEGLGARYHVGTNVPGEYGWIAGARVSALWHLWLR